MTQSIHETKFEFGAFEFQNSKDNVYVECNATFCLRNDNSVGCSQTCHTKRRSYVETGSLFTETGRSSLLSFVNIKQNGGNSICYLKVFCKKKYIYINHFCLIVGFFLFLKLLTLFNRTFVCEKVISPNTVFLLCIRIIKR